MTAREKILRYDHALDCVHCGLCLPVCPTYQHTGRETTSPRGRIYVMRALAEGRLEMTAEAVEPLDSCLVCRACETVCPSGVEFGEMMEITRDEIEGTAARSRLGRGLKRWLFRSLLPHPARLRLVVSLLGLYQRSGLQKAARYLGLVHLFGEKTLLRDALLPAVPSLTSRSVPPAVSAAVGTPRARVGFLVGCVAHELLPDANRAAIEVLRRYGCEVHCPVQRPCCGALPAHFGDREAARHLALQTMSCFDDRLDAVVVSSAGCAATMKEYPRLFEDDLAAQLRAEHFAAKVQDLAEFLIQQPATPGFGTLSLRVAYDEPCHLLHAQKISAAPKQLLATIPGVTLVPLPGQQDCCGAAGLYSVLCPESSAQLLETKMRQVRETRPDVLVTANPGCHLQLRSGAAEWAPDVEVLHIAELLLRTLNAHTDP